MKLYKTYILREEKHAKALYDFLKANWREMAKAGKPLAVEIAPERTKRSVAANAYYWGVTLKAISDQCWEGGRQFPPEAWHEFFKEKFAPRIDVPGGGSKPISTTDMSTEEFQEFVTNVEVYAGEELHVRFTEREMYERERGNAHQPLLCHGPAPGRDGPESAASREAW